jgi:hypothetical protein
MVTKYEYMTNDDIIDNYKRLKEQQRIKNKTAYEKLKLNKVQYRKRLTNALNYQIERIKNIKLDDEAHNEYKEQKKLNNAIYYYNKGL